MLADIVGNRKTKHITLQCCQQAQIIISKCLSERVWLSGENSECGSVVESELSFKYRSSSVIVMITVSMELRQDGKT